MEVGGGWRNKLHLQINAEHKYETKQRENRQ